MSLALKNQELFDGIVKGTTLLLMSQDTVPEFLDEHVIGAVFSRAILENNKFVLEKLLHEYYCVPSEGLSLKERIAVCMMINQE